MVGLCTAKGSFAMQPRFPLQGKNFAAQFFIEKYLSFHGGDSATPLLAKCLY